MKLAVISDIHGNLAALEAVLADIDKQGVDQTVNLGDILSGPLQPAETADLLMARNFTTIRGNHERQVLALVDGPANAVDLHSTDGYTVTQLKPVHIDWLRSLPAQVKLGGDVLLCHGTPSSDLIYWLETTVPGFGVAGASGHPTGIRPATPQEIAERLGPVRHSLVLCGHTHVPRMAQCGGVLIVNPGSVGVPAYDDEHPHPHIVENGAPHARYAIVEKSGAGWLVDLRAVPYGHLAQAKVAAGRGRADWAEALATGWALRPPPVLLSKP